MLQYSVNKCVFSRRLKLSLPRSGSLKLSGREFQSVGRATEKAREPSVLSWHRGTTEKTPSNGYILSKYLWFAHMNKSGNQSIVFTLYFYLYPYLCH